MHNLKIIQLLTLIVSSLVFSSCGHITSEIQLRPTGRISFDTTYNDQGGAFSGTLVTPNDYEEDATYNAVVRPDPESKTEPLMNATKDFTIKRKLTNDERKLLIRLTSPEKIKHYHSQPEVDTPEKNLHVNRCDVDSNPGNHYLMVSFENHTRISRKNFEEKNGNGPQIIEDAGEFIHICWPDVREATDPQTKEFINIILKYREDHIKIANAQLD